MPVATRVRTKTSAGAAGVFDNTHLTFDPGIFLAWLTGQRKEFAQREAQNRRFIYRLNGKSHEGAPQWTGHCRIPLADRMLYEFTVGRDFWKDHALLQKHPEWWVGEKERTPVVKMGLS